MIIFMSTAVFAEVEEDDAEEAIEKAEKQVQRLADPKSKYKDYVIWQNEKLNVENIKKQKEYWINKFSGDLPVLNLPLDYKRPLIQSFKGNMFKFTLSEEFTEKLEAFVRDNQITWNILLLASYSVLLRKYTNQEDIIIGSKCQVEPILI